MNYAESIRYLACENGKRLTPSQSKDDINTSLPFFHIDGETGSITCFNYERHDNGPRMELFKSYMSFGILPNMSKENVKALDGYYNIELHDSYTYLGRDPGMYKNVFTFSKFKTDTGPVLLPDPYMIGNWGHSLSIIKDVLTWEAKQNKACFYGTTTGHRDPRHNARIDMCVWGAKNKERIDFKITKVAQMNVVDIINTIGVDTWKEIYSPRSIHPVEQMQYKFIYGMDGNTCKFDVWPHMTNSLCLREKSKEMVWYYPLMRDQEHFVEVDQSCLFNIMDFYISNPQTAKHIVTNSNLWSRKFFQPMTHIMYTVELFNTIADNAR